MKKELVMVFYQRKRCHNVFPVLPRLVKALENTRLSMTPYKIPPTVTRSNEGLGEPARLPLPQRDWREGRRRFLYVAKEELDGVNPETVYF